MKLAASLVLLLILLDPLYSQTEFSQDNATRLLKTLTVDIGPRPMGSPAEQHALQFAVEKFKEYGCDTAYIMKMDHSRHDNTTSGIAIGIKRGATQRTICIGGHIDSAGPEIPGVDDDGSGAAVVMELARVFGKRRTASTLLFCCFGGEEQGLEGSNYFVDYYENLGEIALMLQVDMANGIGLIDLDGNSHSALAPKWLVSAAIEEFYKLGYDHLLYPTHTWVLNYASKGGAGSDHESFLRKGIPAIDFSTDVSKPIHTPRDNWENFDPRGLKRSGDVVQKIVERFDRGTPNRTTENYYMYMIGTMPVYFPIWLLGMLIAVSIIVGVVAFVNVRQRRSLREASEPPDSQERIRWSSLKMFLMTLIIVACGWMSSDIVSLIKGVRLPWLTDVNLYVVYALVAASFGVWLMARLSASLRLSRCPYVMFKRAAIILLIYTLLFTWADIKLGIYPALTLLLLSLAMLIRKTFVKISLLVFSSVWMLNLLYPEWGLFLYRTIGLSLPSGSFSSVAFTNLVFILLYSLFLYPLFFGALAVVRDTDSFQIVGSWLRSRWVLVGSVAGMIVMTTWLVSRPTYDSFWYQNVDVSEHYDMSRSSKLIGFSSSQYLAGLKVRYGTLDTTFTTKSTSGKLEPRDDFDTTWLRIERKETKQTISDSTGYDVELALHSKFRPYAVKVRYARGSKVLRSLESHWRWRTVDDDWLMSWYSFPDTLLTIPMKLQLGTADSVKETIEVVYDSLAAPMELQKEQAYFIPRTKYVATHVYRK